MNKRDQAKARSLYRQLRLTMTEEAGGDVRWRLSVKPLHANWDESVLWSEGRLHSSNLNSVEDAIALCVEALSENLLVPPLGR